MDRREVLVGLAGLTSAGATFRLVNAQRGASENQGVAAGAPAPAPTRGVGGEGIKSVVMSQVPLGGGGFVTGIDISNDGQLLACRTDVGNAYVRGIRDPYWKPLFTTETLALSDYDPPLELNGKADGSGVAGIRIAPSNRNVIFASHYGYIWKSADGGRSVRRTRLPQKRMLANSGLQRLFNRAIDIHPRDADQIIVGTWGDGVWFSADGGKEWARAKLPESVNFAVDQAGLNLVHYDPVEPGRVFVFITGVGLFCSNTGPSGEFTLAAGGPRICSNLTSSADGTIYVCEHTEDWSGQLWSYRNARGWRSSKLDREPLVVAIQHDQPEKMIAYEANGWSMLSDDSGRSWRTKGPAWSERSGEVAWTRGLTTMFPAEIQFHPLLPNTLWIAHGVGVAKATLTDQKFQLEDHSAGIEELCMVSGISPPGGRLVLSALDKPFWRIDREASYTNDFRYPVFPGQQHNSDLVAFSSYLDFAGDDPQYLVGVVGPSDRSAPGYSTDGGKSWKAFEGKPSTGWGYGGCIAASTKKNIVLLPSNNATGAYTLDGGKMWSSIKLNGLDPTGGFANAYYVARKNLTSDKTRPGTFALVYTVIKENNYGEPLGGVWVTRDGGQSWTQNLLGVISEGSHDARTVRGQGLDERQFWQCQLEYSPDRFGGLLYTPHSDYADDRFYWSQDDGKNWEEFAEVRNVSCFGFGKAAGGQDRSAIYFWGQVRGEKALYATFDWFKTTPKLIARHPCRMLNKVSFVVGDPDRFGRVTVGTVGAGAIAIDVTLA